MIQIEMMSIWKCIYCKAENDHTNATRCWNCNKKKPSLKTVKTFRKKQKKLEMAKEQYQKQQVISKIDNIMPKEEKPMIHDLTTYPLDP